jgi:hypothetical protein
MTSSQTLFEDALDLGVMWAPSGTDDTTAINSLLATYATVLLVGRSPYRVHGSIVLSPGNTLMSFGGAVIDHFPPDNETDLITVSGAVEVLTHRPTVLSNLVLRGQQESHAFGRDLVRICRGDHVQARNLVLHTAKRDGLHVEPFTNNEWSENLTFENVKVQTPGRDGFHFAIPEFLTNVFINQVSLVQCEGRYTSRHALAVVCNNTQAPANKISNIGCINCELAVGGVNSDAIVRLAGPSSGGSIENIRFVDSTIEDTAFLRTGSGVEVTGRCTGTLKLDNDIVYGVTGQRVSGFRNFPFYDVYDGNTTSPYFRSQIGVAEKYRTAPLLQGGFENCSFTLQDEDILKVYVRHRDNRQGWAGEWTVFGRNMITSAYSLGATLAIVSSGSTRLLQVTNTGDIQAELELFIQRVLSDPSA